jgi:hypothetical protein
MGLNGSIVAAVGIATGLAFALGSSDAFAWGTFTSGLSCRHRLVRAGGRPRGAGLAGRRIRRDAAGCNQRGDWRDHRRGGLWQALIAEARHFR